MHSKWNLLQNLTRTIRLARAGRSDGQTWMDGGRVVVELRAGKETRVVVAPNALAHTIAACTAPAHDTSAIQVPNRASPRRKFASAVFCAEFGSPSKLILNSCGKWYEDAQTESYLSVWQETL